MAYNYQELAQTLTGLSPLAEAGIDPDDAFSDQRAAEIQMARQRAGRGSLPPTTPATAAVPSTVQADPAKQTPDPQTQQPPLAASPQVMTPGSAREAQRAKLASQEEEQYRRANELEDQAEDLTNQRLQKSSALQSTIERLRGQRSADSAATPLYGADQKMLPQYKPSFSDRVLRGVRAVAGGGVLAAIDPRIGGQPEYGAPNRAYTTAEAARQGRLAAENQEIGDTQKEMEDLNKQGTADAAEIRAGATTRRDTNRLLHDTATDITKQEENANNTPEAKAQKDALVSQNEYNQRQVRLRTDPALSKLNSTQKAYYAATGKIPEPHYASAEEQEWNAAHAAWVRDHGGKRPGLDGIREITKALGKGRQGDTGMTDSQKNSVIAKKDTAISRAMAQIGKSDRQGNIYTKEDARRDAQAAQDAFEEEILASGGTVDHMEMDDNLNWKKASGNRAPKAAPNGAPEGASSEVYDQSGNLIGHGVNGKYVPLGGPSRNPNQGDAASASPSYITPSLHGQKISGLSKPGNIDLSRRKDIQNPDGSHSSVFSMSFGTDDGEVLVPGVGDGTTYPYRKLTEKEALDQYRKTGKNFGTFNTPENADRYGTTLHKDQEKMKSVNGWLVSGQ